MQTILSTVGLTSYVFHCAQFWHELQVHSISVKVFDVRENCSLACWDAQRCEPQQYSCIVSLSLSSCCFSSTHYLDVSKEVWSKFWCNGSSLSAHHIAPLRKKITESAGETYQQIFKYQKFPSFPSMYLFGAAGFRQRRCKCYFAPTLKTML